MNGCDKYQELISRMVDGDLSAAESAELRAHVETCPDCARVYAAFAALSSAISEDLEEPPEELHENIMAGVRRQRLRRGLWARLPRQYKSLLAAAACIALIAGFSWAAENLVPRASTAAPITAGGAANAASANRSAQDAESGEAAPADSGAAMAIDLPEAARVEVPVPAPDDVPGTGADGAAAPISVADGEVWRELLELLSGEPAGEIPSGAEQLYTFVLAGGGELRAAVWSLDGELYCLEEPEGAVSACACTAEELKDFLAQSGLVS